MVSGRRVASMHRVAVSQVFSAGVTASVNSPRAAARAVSSRAARSARTAITDCLYASRFSRATTR
jgi:hypothetical protein